VIIGKEGVHSHIREQHTFFFFNLASTTQSDIAKKRKHTAEIILRDMQRGTTVPNVSTISNVRTASFLR
jgi:hypothetical protein